MYVEINEKLLRKVEKITSTDYGILEHKVAYVNGLGDAVKEVIRLAPIDSVASMIEDLVYEYHILTEKFEDFKQEVNENWELKKFDPYHEYGVSKNDFC